MDEFRDEFGRRRDQEIVDFNRNWHTEITKAEKAAGQLPVKWKTHLYLKKLRMPTTAKSQNSNWCPWTVHCGSNAKVSLEFISEY